MSSSLEEAADEIARLDQLCATAPASFSHALRSVVLAELTSTDGTTPALLLAADADALHDAALGPLASRWRPLLDAEERRTRGGAPLSVTRLLEVAPSLGTYPNRGRLEAIWREGGRARPVLVRALDAVAWFPEGDPAAGDATAGLLLCAGARTDRLRLLPFARAATERRVAAIAAWRGGEQAPWAELGLGAAAHRARQLRDLIEAGAAERDGEAELIGSMGRAGINAARALGLLRESLVTTIPALSEDLALSRPAAAAALERLAHAGLVREITGRSRDRVHAYVAALGVAERALAD